MDEPNAHLDLSHQVDVYRLARSLAADGRAVLIICHDLLVSPLMVDAALVLSGGRIVASGPVRDVLSSEILDRVFATRASIVWDGASAVTARFDR